jgi:hypothetical protein
VPRPGRTRIGRRRCRRCPRRCAAVTRSLGPAQFLAVVVVAELLAAPAGAVGPRLGRGSRSWSALRPLRMLAASGLRACCLIRRSAAAAGCGVAPVCGRCAHGEWVLVAGRRSPGRGRSCRRARDPPIPRSRRASARPSHRPW